MPTQTPELTPEKWAEKWVRQAQVSSFAGPLIEELAALYAKAAAADKLAEACRKLVSAVETHATVNGWVDLSEGIIASYEQARAALAEWEKSKTKEQPHG